MKNKIKKLFCSIICMALIFSSIQMDAFYVHAEEIEDTFVWPEAPSDWYKDFNYTLEEDEIILTDYLHEDASEETLVIPGTATIDGIEYKTVLNGVKLKNGMNSKKEKCPKNIKICNGVLLRSPVKYGNSYAPVSFGAGVERICFEKCDCSGLTNTCRMFNDCRSLTKLDLDGLDTSNVTSMSGSFAGCKSLTELDLSVFDTSNVTSMDSMFYGCSGLTKLDLRAFDTSNVTTMGSMFNGCSGLTDLNLSSFDTSNVTSVGAMFSRCSGLTDLDLSNFDTSNVTGMDSMFNGCSGLTDLDLSNFDTSNVTSMRMMFYGCSNLTALDLSNFDTSKTTTMQEMFSYCCDITKLDLSNFDTSHVTSMRGMFNGCRNLTELDIRNFDTSNVKDVRGMFRDCSNLKNLSDYQICLPGLVLDKEDKTNSEDEFVFENPNDFYDSAHIWRGVEWDTNITLSATSKVDIGELSYSWAQVQLYPSGVGADEDDPSDDAIWYSHVNPGNVSNERAYTPIYNNTKDMEVSAWLCSSKDSCGNSISESYWICYNIHYNLNGGTNHPSNPKYVDGYDAITYPQELGVKKFPLYAPTRTGYKFEGWYENADFSGEPRTYLTVCDMKKLTLYAKWSPTSHTHKKTTVITKATTKKDGSITVKCSECGKTLGKTVIPSIKSVTLSGTSFTYNAKEKKPTVTVKDRTGKTISKSYYTVSYKNTKNVGLAEVTVKFKGRYKGTIKRTFTILPKTPALSKVKAIEKGLSITWKKTATQLTGYQIQIATDKNFKKNSKVYTISGKNSTSKKITKLKKNTKYYIRIRTYKTVGGKKYYSGWKTYSKAVRVSK